MTFHVDCGFGESLDGLIVVDLTKTDRRWQERYLGKEGSERFLAHQLGAAANAPGAANAQPA